MENINNNKQFPFNQYYANTNFQQHNGFQNSWHNANGIQYYALDEDIDSDILDGSDDTNSGSDNESISDDGRVDEAKQLEDEENYIRFVQSVFCDDDMISAASFTDEEDEEYRPDETRDDDEDDDFDGGDRDKVKDKELQGLVNECWQTIVGEAPMLPNGAGDDENYSFNCEVDMNPDENIEVEHNILHSDTLTSSDRTNGGIHSPHHGNVHSHRRGSSGVGSPNVALGSLFPNAGVTSNNNEVHSNCSNTSSPSKSAKLSNNGSVRGRSGGTQSVISSIVSQLFSGDRPSEVCVEGMPVDAIRKLVARQMSMATQLLVQILLQADEKSECFTTAYTSLMELSNLRETAVKKAKLIEMNMQNVNSIRQNFVTQRQESMRDHHHLPPHEVRDNIHSHSHSHSSATGAVFDRRLTRSGVGSAVNARSSSVFDIPALSQVSALFDSIDASRRFIKQQLQANSIAVRQPTVSFSEDVAVSSGNNSSILKSSDSQGTTQNTSAADNSTRARLLSLACSETNKIVRQSGMRAWNCIAPLSHYPLPEHIMMRTDPTSLIGRSVFTPAEDDLLLRGIITLGEGNWARIKSVFLPSKETQLLQFRFTQMTNLSAPPDSNNFKRYQKLEVEYRNRDLKWSQAEDIDLLRGFQVFGEKWPLIAIYFLPHRKRREIKIRWTAHQKTWLKSFQIHQLYQPGGIPAELTPFAREFLIAINSNRNNNLQHLGAAGRGGGGQQMVPTFGVANPYYPQSYDNNQLQQQRQQSQHFQPNVAMFPQQLGNAMPMSNGGHGFAIHPLDELEFEQDDLSDDDDDEDESELPDEVGGLRGIHNPHDFNQYNIQGKQYPLSISQQIPVALQQQQQTQYTNPHSSSRFTGAPPHGTWDPPRNNRPMNVNSLTNNGGVGVPLNRSVVVPTSSSVIGPSPMHSSGLSLSERLNKAVAARKKGQTAASTNATSATTLHGNTSTVSRPISNTAIVDIANTESADDTASQKKRKQSSITNESAAATAIAETNGENGTESGVRVKRKYKPRKTNKQKEEELLLAQQQLQQQQSTQNNGSNACLSPAHYHAEHGDALAGLLALPMDEHTMDSSWGHHSNGSPGVIDRDMLNVSNLNYSSIMAHAFDEPTHMAAALDLVQSPQPTMLANDSLLFGADFSNLSQLGSLLFGSEVLMSPTPGARAANALRSPNSALKSKPCFSPPNSRAKRSLPNDDSFAFSPPTTKLGNPTHVKRQSTNAASDNNSKKQKGGLFASVMANSK